MRLFQERLTFLRNMIKAVSTQAYIMMETTQLCGIGKLILNFSWIFHGIFPVVLVDL